jgi:hypothetical protein
MGSFSIGAAESLAALESEDDDFSVFNAGGPEIFCFVVAVLLQ